MNCALEEKFPRIVMQLAESWPDGHQASDYLDHLLFLEGDRNERHGFTDEIWQELFFLHQLLLLEYPSTPSGTATDIWATALEVGATS
jgi:hypothetical protein